MNASFPTTTLALAAAACTALPASAHDGRRFQVEVVDGQLRAQGVNTLERPVDPAGVRPYFNALHGHFNEAGESYFGTLPGYDLGAGSEALIGKDLRITVTGASKWAVPDGFLEGPMGKVREGIAPSFSALDAGESLLVNFGGPTGTTLDTSDLGAGDEILLVSGYDGRTAVIPATGFSESSNGSNGFDIDLTYALGEGTPREAVLYVLEAQLSTSDLAIADSETFFTILSPAGSGPFEKRHFASLTAEAALGTPVPEPAGIAALAGLGGLLLRPRR